MFLQILIFQGIESFSVIRDKNDPIVDPVESFPKNVFKKEEDYQIILAYLKQVKDY